MKVIELIELLQKHKRNSIVVFGIDSTDSQVFEITKVKARDIFIYSPTELYVASEDDEDTVSGVALYSD